jgi:DHA2 family multidrug resistance protein
VAKPGFPSLNEPLHGAQLLIAGLLLAIGNFVVVLDTTIANVSIPNIAGGISVSPSQGTWVITSYAVADAIVVPLTGWLAMRYGPVKVFCAAMMMFGFWSAVCGISHSLTTLVIARIFQGASGGPMIPLSQTLLLRVFGRARAGAATGIWASTTLVAPIMGPILGGELCDRLSWPWIFYVNVPLAFACSFAVWRLLGRRDDATKRVPVDFVGLLLLIVWVGAMQIILDKGREADWFSSPFIVAMSVIGVVGFVAFILWEITADNPVVNLKVFQNRSFSLCCLVLALGFGASFASWVLVPLWLQVNMGYTATLAGRVSGMNGIVAFLVAPFVARMLGKIDARKLISFGLAVGSIAMLMRTGFASNATFWGVALPNCVQGFCTPFFFLPITAVALANFEGEIVASAAGLASFVRTTAGAFGASIFTSLWDDSATRSHADLAASLSHPDQSLMLLQQMGMSIDQARAQIEYLISGQAVMLATIYSFYVLAAVFVVAAGAIWFVPRPRRPVAAAASH